MANKGGITRGEYKAIPFKGAVEGFTVYTNDEKGVCAYTFRKEDAEFICLCANQCQAVNPTHPEYVAERIGESIKLLKLAKLFMLEHRALEFAGVNEIYCKIESVLADIERKE